ncbi:MAG: PorT family protein [Salinivirgaceae bacterium]|nr:PorT family protein [Salinivirgaceae bacterium]
MKIKTIIFLLFLLPTILLAQKSKVWNKPLYDAYKYHFGFAFSGGLLDFSVTHSENFMSDTTINSIEGQARPLFGVSMVSNLRLNENFDLRFTPGLYFGQRNLVYNHNVLNKTDSTYSPQQHVMKIETTFLQFPLNIKYRAVRENNYRPYVVFGVNYVIDLAARKKIKEEEKPKIRLYRQDILLEAGFGVDYYLPFFKLSTELRFSYGLMNIVNYDDTPYTNNTFERLGTKMVSLIVFFE